MKKMAKWKQVISLFIWAKQNEIEFLTCRDVADKLYKGEIKCASVALSSLASKGYLNRESLRGRNIKYSATGLYEANIEISKKRKDILNKYEIL